MTRVSRHKLQDQRAQEISDHFSHLIASLTTSSEIENFLNDFLTREEKIMLAKRLVLFMMIKRNYSSTTIQSALHVSYETVRNYSNQIYNKGEIFQKTLNKLIGKEKSKEFWEKIDKMLKPLDLFLRSKNDMKARAKFTSGGWS